MKDFKQFEDFLKARIIHDKEILSRLKLPITPEEFKQFFYGYVAALEENELINNECFLLSQKLISEMIQND